MVERAGRQQLGTGTREIDATKALDHAAETSADQQTPLEQPDAPKGVVEGAYHQRALAGTGPSGLVSIRLMDAEGPFRSAGAKAFAALLKDVTRPGPEGVAAANKALDTLINYLDQRTDHANQVGSLHEAVQSTPVDERVPLLRRSVHVLRKAVRDGVLPAHNLSDLKRLSRISQGMGWNFDLDDNIASLDTEVIVFDKQSGEERAFSTAEFAEARDHIGKPGPFERYEYRYGDGDQHSFRNFRDDLDPGVFRRDLENALKTKGWQAPSWTAFQRAMSSPETAKWSTIITARGHYPNTIHSGLRHLVDLGHLERTPPRENIFPVNLPGLAGGLGGDAAFPSASKVRVMEKYLDRMQAAPMGPSAQRVIPPDGSQRKRFMHLWGFSDDDYGTFKRRLKSSATKSATAAGRTSRSRCSSPAKAIPKPNPTPWSSTPMERLALAYPRRRTRSIERSRASPNSKPSRPSENSDQETAPAPTAIRYTTPNFQRRSPDQETAPAPAAIRFRGAHSCRVRPVQDEDVL